MAVHAHPDDESMGTGGVLARYSAEGFRTVLVTCTNGELGDGPGHVKPDEEGHDEEQVATTRLAELDAACAALAVSSLELLGYHDSGMRDWRFKDLDAAFCNVPVDAVADRLAALIVQYRPRVVITYDDYGGYNHPDHVHAHDATVAAVERTGIPSKLYYTARRRRDWERLREAMLARGVELPSPPRLDREMEERLAAIEARITTRVDTAAYAASKRAALAAHASQLDHAWWTAMSPEEFEAAFGEETFIRASDVTGARIPEND